MKVRLLIFLLLCCDIANADDGNEQDLDPQSKKQGDTIWLEEKISPTARWLDDLVKPLTVWIEQQIHEPEQLVDSEDVSPIISEEPPLNLNADDGQEPALLNSTEQASKLAKEHINGDVLYNKFLSESNQYRVKLISKVGEIHIIYVNAASGKIVSLNNRVGIESTTKQGSQAEHDSDANNENKEEP